jgi:predicted phosphodiesterase
MGQYSRREFLKFAGGAGAGFLLGSLIPASSRTAAFAAGDAVGIRGGFIKSFEPGLLRVRALSLEPAVTISAEAFKDGNLKVYLSNIAASRLDVKCEGKIEQTSETETLVELRLPAAGTAVFETSFHALPGERLNFIAFSDTHLGAPEAEEHFARILKHTNLSHPLFAVNAGDNVDVDEPAQWKIFAERTAAMAVPLFATIGNHDSYISTKLYRKNLGDLFYGFKAFDTQLLFLDNSQKHNNATLFMDGNDFLAQWDWLEKQLLEPAKHRFVFFHFPMFGGRSMLDPMYMIGTPLDKRTEEVDHMMALFRKTGVEYICFGHLHSPERTVKDGVVFLRLGGGGGSKASSTDDKDVSFAHIFADENGIRDYTVFMYHAQNEIERIVFCEPFEKLPVGANAPIIVRGVAKDGRLLGIDAEINLVSGPGRITNNVYIAEKSGQASLEARFEQHYISFVFDVT